MTRAMPFGRACEDSDQAAEIFLPSRDRARTALHAAAELRQGPVLLSGEAGSGKTWLVRRWMADDPKQRIWLSVDLSPMTRPLALLHDLLFRLGGPAVRSASALRILSKIAGILEDGAADGRHYALVIDEAHLATRALLEQVRLLSNSIGRPEGFDTLVLVGQTRLVRHLAQSYLTTLASRIAGHVHLGPIDADEAAVLLGLLSVEGTWSDDLVERLHRDAHGNPRRLLTLARIVNADQPAVENARRTPRHTGSAPPTRVAVEAEAANGDRDDLDEPSAESRRPWVPTRPVVQSEENVIEVGWDSDPDVTAAGAEMSELGKPASWSADRLVQPIADPYAALQAAIEAEGAGAREPCDEAEVPWYEQAPQPVPPGERLGSNNIWSDTPHPFEPYGDLFVPSGPATRVDP